MTSASVRGSLDFESALADLIIIARKEFGETEYAYYRVGGLYRDSFERVVSREGWREVLLKIIKELHV
jgi:hypothetical protein